MIHTVYPPESADRRFPVSPVRLADGRLLTLERLFDMEVAPGIVQQAYRWSGPKTLSVIAGAEHTPRFGVLYHVSVAYRERLPSWKDVRLVRDALLPADRDFMMLLPREEDYISLHRFCFHVWECPTEWGMR